VRPAILHADVDAFYASVAQRDDPGLRGRPVVVGSWVVMAASYEARAFGVRGGMATSTARRLCPDMVIAEPSWESFSAASKAIFAVFERCTPIVEPGSMEEAFLDVTAVGAPPAEVAARLRREVREEAGLPLSVGVARTKVLAKIASRSAKPDGLFVVEPEHELEFLHPLPVERLWGVGPATARRLHAYGIRRVGQAAALSEADLMAILGKASGRYVHAIARNHEHRPVRRRRGRRSFGAQRALGRSPRSRAELDAAVGDLAERVTRRMQRKARAGRTVSLRLRFGDYTRATRSCTLACPTADAGTIARAARELLDAAMPMVTQRGITLVGVTVTNLDGTSGPQQLTLPLGDGGEPAGRVACMPAVTLAVARLPMLEAALQGPDALSRALDGRAIADGWEVFPDSVRRTRDVLAADPDGGRWGTRLFLLDEPPALVGWGGFKGPPDGDGTVELGYAVAPGFRRRGIATEAVRQMLDDAWSEPEVRAVLAHTLAERNPSTMVLEATGFAFDAEVDGGPRVWRWRHDRPAADEARR
jgi:DNA polymerase-4